MDVVALAQHGIDYAVATLGTATTPAHVQKLFRQTDRVVFCFDGDAAGRKAAWRALENALPVLADGKNAAFLFLPDGEDPDDFVRRRGKAAFEALADQRDRRCRNSCWPSSARSTPRRRRKARRRWSPPRARYSRRSTAPVLAALLRRRLADLTGLPETELRAPARSPRRATATGVRRRHRRRATCATIPEASFAGRLSSGSAARPRSSVNSSRRCCSNQNWRVPASLPQPRGGTPEDAALSALVALLRRKRAHADHGGGHAEFRAIAARIRCWRARWRPPKTRESRPEQAAVHLAAGSRVTGSRPSGMGSPGRPDRSRPRLAEEAERLRQLEMVRTGRSRHSQSQNPARDR